MDQRGEKPAGKDGGKPKQKNRSKKDKKENAAKFTEMPNTLVSETGIAPEAQETGIKMETQDAGVPKMPSYPNKMLNIASRKHKQTYHGGESSSTGSSDEKLGPVPKAKAQSREAVAEVHAVPPPAVDLPSVWQTTSPNSTYIEHLEMFEFPGDPEVQHRDHENRVVGMECAILKGMKALVKNKSSPDTESVGDDRELGVQEVQARANEVNPDCVEHLMALKRCATECGNTLEKLAHEPSEADKTIGVIEEGAVESDRTSRECDTKCVMALKAPVKLQSCLKLRDLVGLTVKNKGTTKQCDKEEALIEGTITGSESDKAMEEIDMGTTEPDGSSKEFDARTGKEFDTVTAETKNTKEVDIGNTDMEAFGKEFDTETTEMDNTKEVDTVTTETNKAGKTADTKNTQDFDLGASKTDGSDKEFDIGATKTEGSGKELDIGATKTEGSGKQFNRETAETENTIQNLDQESVESEGTTKEFGDNAAKAEGTIKGPEKESAKTGGTRKAGKVKGIARCRELAEELRATYRALERETQREEVRLLTADCLADMQPRPREPPEFTFEQGRPAVNHRMQHTEEEILQMLLYVQKALVHMQNPQGRKSQLFFIAERVLYAMSNWAKLGPDSREYEVRRLVFVYVCCSVNEVFAHRVVEYIDYIRDVKTVPIMDKNRLQRNYGNRNGDRRYNNQRKRGGSFARPGHRQK